MAKKNIVIDTGSSRTTVGGETTSKSKGVDDMTGSDLPSKEEYIKPGIEDEEAKLEDNKTKDDKVIIPDGSSAAEKATVSDHKLEIDGTSYTLDDSGNAIDARGNVFKTKEEIDALEASDDTETQDETVLVIDDNEFKVDDKGNAVNDKGEVVYTAEQVAAMGEADTSPTFDITKLQDDTKVVTYDDKGEIVKYANDNTGLQNYVSDIYEQATMVGAEDYMKVLNSRFPVLNSVLNHLQLNNGKMDGFQSSVNYDSIELDKGNDEQLVGMISAARRYRGEDDTRIKGYIDFIKSTDSNNDALLREAEAEKGFLNNIEVNRRANEEAAIKSQKDTDNLNAQRYWGYTVDDTNSVVDLNVENSVYSLVNGGKIELSKDESFNIPEKIKRVENGKPVMKSRSDFLDYLATPKSFIIDGQKVNMTAHDYDVHIEDSRRNIGNDIADAFKRYVGYDISSYIRDEVGKEEVRRVVKRLSSKRSLKGKSTKPAIKKRIVINTNK